MFRPSHPRVMNYRPRFYPQQDWQWGTHPESRAFYGKNNLFRPRPPHILENSNLTHWCETCDRGFPTAKYLEEHKLQHQKCNIDGCQFVAHPKVITKHIQMQHSSGLYKKISKLNNPDEIKKWLEERKKNFPTRSNIEKKAAELKEKIDRGEKMGLSQRQRFRDSKPDNKRKLESSNKRHNDKKDFKKKKIYNENKETEIKNKPMNLRNTIKYLPCEEDKIRITPFSGIQELVCSQAEDDAEETNDDLIEDDHEIVIRDSQKTSNASEPVLCGALLTLMCQYGSSDEQETNAVNSNQPSTKSKHINKTKDKSHSIENKESDIIAPKPLTSCEINHDDDDSGPEETKVVKNIEEKDNESTQKETVKNLKKKPLNKSDNKHIYSRKPKSKLASTLLQKLLSREMQHERNMVLQCVRHVIKNNFFEK